MRYDPGSVPHADPLAFFLTWTTYGSWLPGDARGWVDRHGAMREKDDRILERSRRLLRRDAVTFTPHQRDIVRSAIRRHCIDRRWWLHAEACRTEHVHVVVTAIDVHPSAVLRELKAWATKSLPASDAACRFGGRDSKRSAWWARGGSMRRIYDQQALENVVRYVNECQDQPRIREDGR